MYSKEQKDIALRIYHQTESVTETIRILGYPTRRNLYTWIAEENTPPKTRKEYPVIDNPPDHPRNPPLEVKLNAIHRCYELGENIKYVSEDIGYSRASIYQWRKRYLKEGTLGLMNHKNITLLFHLLFFIIVPFIIISSYYFYLFTYIFHAFYAITI